MMTMLVGEENKNQGYQQTILGAMVIIAVTVLGGMNIISGDAVVALLGGVMGYAFGNFRSLQKGNVKNEG